MKPEQLVRVRFIDAMLEQYGMVTRKMLIDVFGVSGITATRDINAYREFSPRMYRCTHTKCYRTCTDFSKIPELWGDATPTQFLRGIEAVYDIKIGMQPVPVFGIHKA